jgi:hypothetical protein
MYRAATQHNMISLHKSVLQIVDESACRTNIEPTHSLPP